MLDIDLLKARLIAAAKGASPSEEAPYAFEQRIMAIVRARPVKDVWQDWAMALWKAVMPCLAIVVCLGIWAVIDAQRQDPFELDPAQDLENTMLASVGPSADTQ